MDVSSFSADEHAAIAALREEVLAWIDAGETADPTADGTEAAQYMDDATLWRYAKARECDIEQALEMFKSSLCWKRETGIKQVWAQCPFCAACSTAPSAIPFTLCTPAHCYPSC